MRTLGKRARKILQKLESGENPFSSSVLTFSDLAEEYTEKYAARNHSKSWLKFQRSVLARDLLPALGDRPLAQIQRRELISLLDEIGERGIFISNRTQAILMAIFNLTCSPD